METTTTTTATTKPAKGRMCSNVRLGNRSMKRPDVFVITHALKAGCTISVINDGDALVSRSTSHKEIFEMLDELDEALVRIRNANDEKIGSIFVVYDYNQCVDEMVADYSDGYVSDLMDKYNEQHNN